MFRPALIRCGLLLGLAWPGLLEPHSAAAAAPAAPRSTTAATATLAGHPPPALPERVILNLTDQPATSLALTWRAGAPPQTAHVQVALATDGAGYAREARTVPARIDRLVTDKGEVFFHCAVTLTELSPATTYVYRVGNDHCWSEWNQFTTAALTAEPFQIVWFGDPQEDLLTHVSRTFRQAFRTAPAARFWLYSGDLTGDPDDRRYGEFFAAAGFIFRQTPQVMAPGNHDLGFVRENGAYVLDAKGKKKRVSSVDPLWRAHFTQPENGLASDPETTFAFDYQGVRCLVLDTNSRLPEKAAWLERQLAAAATQARWVLVAFHHPLYSSGRTRDDQSTRQAFLPLFDRYQPDLVLTGHDHTYARSHPLRGGRVVPAGTRGTVYLVSASGPKVYPYNPNYQELMAQTGEGLELFQVLTCGERTLRVETYTAAGRLFDSFTLQK